MLENATIETRLSENEQVAYACVEGDGYHYQITVVSPVFEEKRRVARQQWVYQILQEWIADGSLHAVTLHTYSPHEWEEHNG